MAESGKYTIEWKKKPLGFSIVMDTSGKNAYVSSIQNTLNIEKGLRLAAQIIQINDTSVVDWKHEEILNLIKSTDPPLKLTFRQRTFANESSKNAEVPEVLKFEGAVDARANRVNGYFELVNKEKICGKHVWQRKDNQEDKIICWWWSKADASKALPEKCQLEQGLWMVSRRSHQKEQKGNAYAVVQSDCEFPTQIDGTWDVFGAGGFEKSKIVIKSAKL